MPPEEMEEDEEKSSLVATKQEDKKVELGSLLKSRKALKAFHSKCMETVQQRNITYLDQDDITQLLGGPSEAKPAFVADLINMLLSQVTLSFASLAY